MQCPIHFNFEQEMGMHVVDYIPLGWILKCLDYII